MNFFEKIHLENYRNFNNYSINLNRDCNVIYGINGSGKTNILESISLFERGRGFRKEKIENFSNNKSTNNIFKVSSKYINNNNEVDLVITNKIYENKFKKKLTINGSDSNESIKHFENLFSIICFLPEMERFFLSTPSVRRNFLDKLIYGVDRDYLTILNQYKKKVLERNKILKQHIYDQEWIKQVEIEIANIGMSIFQKRIHHLNILNSNLSLLNQSGAKFYQIELQTFDNYILDFKSSYDKVRNSYLLELKKSRDIDSIIGGCKIGPHKTDIVGINHSNQLNVNQSSTGQQKTVVLLIIIAQCKYLLETLKRKPVILFDEVCSHLDKNNRSLLLDLINSLSVQTIMTGTEKDFFSFLSTKASYYNITMK